MIDLATIKAETEARSETRRYVGASSIGSNCDAMLALSLRGFPSDMPDPQLLRIFSEGHDVEAKVVAALKAAGYSVSEIDPATGKQYAYISHGGHHRAHLDGLIREPSLNETMTLEVKSMNRAMFDKFKKRGVKLSHPEYYAQVQDGLFLARNMSEPFSKCFFIAYCKDNSQYHVEIVEYEGDAGRAMFEKADRIVIHSHTAQRIGKHENEYECKQCFKRASCWKPDVQDRQCWHCAHARAEVSGDGKLWNCSINGGPATKVCTAFMLYRPKKAP